MQLYARRSGPQLVRLRVRCYCSKALPSRSNTRARGSFYLSVSCSPIALASFLLLHGPRSVASVVALLGALAVVRR
jgi:hypothetical protein